jgi:Fibronectin type III domain
MKMHPGTVCLPLLALAAALACHPPAQPAPEAPKPPRTPHSVTLMWKAPRVPPRVSVIGYNVYRWTKNDSRNVRIATQIPGPPFEDRQVASGETYFYAITAVDQAGRESRLSENIQATIP